MASSTYKLTIPSSTRYLEDVRRFIETHTVEAGFNTQSVEQFKVAVDEACTNVIKHAYSGEDSHELNIKVIVDSDRFTVCIRDKGVAFRPKEYNEPDIFELAKRRQAGGFGVHIMRRLMDHVEYSSQGKVNEVRLTKYLNSHVKNGR
ncbi:MAG: ATP-binding protein [Bacteroidota bacterium]